MTTVFVRRWAVALLVWSPALVFVSNELVSLKGSPPLALTLCIAVTAKVLLVLVYAMAVISFLLALFPEIWVAMVRLTAPASTDDSREQPSGVTNLQEWDKQKVAETRHPNRRHYRGA